MQPQLDHFLQRLQEHRQELASQPSAEEVFAADQFKTVVAALEKATKTMREFFGSFSPDVTVQNMPKTIGTPDVKNVVVAIKALEKTLKPVTADNSDIVKAIEALELNPTYKPEINVSPTPVTVAAPVVKIPKLKLDAVIKAIVDNKATPVDFKAVIATLKDVKMAIDTKPTPVANVPTDPLIAYTPADIDDAGTVQYFGFTQVGGAWYIRKYDTSVSPKTLRFAFGQSNYATNFSNRAALTYSIWGT